jgi:hypothetical protein
MGGGPFGNKMRSRASAGCLAILLLPLVLAACQTDDASTGTTFFGSDDNNQPFPNNYKSEIVAFMHTYLNNPVGLHDAAMAEPVQRTVGGRVRYVSCLRFSEKQSDGSYREPRERAILFINGRLDRVLPSAGDVCAGAVYAAFPELQNLQR